MMVTYLVYKKEIVDKAHTHNCQTKLFASNGTKEKNHARDERSTAAGSTANGEWSICPNREKRR